MNQYIQFCLILFGLKLFKAAVIIQKNQETKNDSLQKYCEIFQDVNFSGGSLQIPESQKINNFTQVIQSWNSSQTNGMDDGGSKFHSFKLPLDSSEEFVCVVKVCTSENFKGNCTVFKISQKQIASCRLKSFECSCYNEHSAKGAENAKLDDSISDDHTTEQTCDVVRTLNTTFQDFTKNGKKIIGVGRNYVWHKTDLSKVVAGGASPENPIIFLKPTTSYLLEGNQIHIPHNIGVIYYELELAVIIGKKASNVEETNALDYVAGYALALDMTAKEILKSSISKGLPWELSKGFDGACPIGNFIPKECIRDPHDLQLSASINGITKQDDSTSKMIFKIPQLISYVSHYMTLEPNDVILTGTPDGFGQIKSGDVIEGFLNQNLAKIKFFVA